MSESRVDMLEKRAAGWPDSEHLIELDKLARDIEAELAAARQELAALKQIVADWEKRYSISMYF